MKGLFSIFLTFSLIGCASLKKEAVVPVDNSSNKPELDVEVYSFSQEVKSTEAEEKDSLQRDEENQCADEQVLFLVKYPFRQIQYMKDYYEGLVIINSLSQQFLELTLLNRNNSLSEEEFAIEAEKLAQQMSAIYSNISGTVQVVRHIESFTRIYFPGCQEKMKEVLELVDEKRPNSCEYEQQLAYILDPFFLKNSLNEGIYLELTISEHLKDLHKIVHDESEKKITSQEALKLFKEKVGILHENKLEAQSLEMIEQIQGAYQATMGIKSTCLEDLSKKEKFKTNK